MASPFSGRAGRLAGMAQAMQLQQTQGQIDQRIQQGQAQSLKSLGNANKRARKDYGAAIKSFQPYASTGLSAFNQYADASGVNGQEGYDRSVGNFRAGPGYQWQVDQATDAVARKASALGALGSGNTMTAITDRASHLADQEYDNYLGRLQGIGQMGFAATGQQAGFRQGLGNLAAQHGQARAGVYGQSTGLGVNSLANTGRGLADATGNAMMAGQTAAANRFGAGMAGLQLGASLLGGAMGGGGLGSLFGGGAAAGGAPLPPMRQFEYPTQWQR